MCLFAQRDQRQRTLDSWWVCICVCPFVNDHLDAKHRNENLDLSVNYKAIC